MSKKRFISLLTLVLVQLARAFVGMAPRQPSTSTASSSACSAADGDYGDIKGIIFDIDGTLADSGKLGFEATLQILARNDIAPITEEIYHQHTRYATPDRLARHAGLEPSHDEYRATGAKLAKEFDDLYVGLVSRETAGLYRGMEELLLQIPPHVTLGALSNAAARYVDKVLLTNCPSKTGRSAIYPRFRSIRGADNVDEPKPSPSGLFAVCDDLGLDPSECVYIGDSPTDGVAAEAAGMPAIGVLWGSHREESMKEAPFKHLCRSVAELQALLPHETRVL